MGRNLLFFSSYGPDDRKGFGDWRVFRAIQSLWKKLEYFGVIVSVRQIIEALPFYLHVHGDLNTFQMVLVQAKISSVGNTF